jgi:hypothetical protein
MKQAPVFSLRLTLALYACCKHYAEAEGVSMQHWIAKRLERAVGQEALIVATYAALAGKTPKEWPPLA